MVTGYLWLHGFVPIATAIHIVSCLVRSTPRRSELFITLKGHFLSSYRRGAARPFGSCFSRKKKKKTAVFHLKINQKLRAKKSILWRRNAEGHQFTFCRSFCVAVEKPSIKPLTQADWGEPAPSRGGRVRDTPLVHSRSAKVSRMSWARSRIFDSLMCLHPTSQMLLGKDWPGQPRKKKKGGSCKVCFRSFHWKNKCCKGCKHLTRSKYVFTRYVIKP